MEWEEFASHCADGMPPHLRVQLKRLRTLADMDNIRALSANEPWNPCGNWTEVAAKDPEKREISPFFRQLLEGYSAQQILAAFPRLWIEFFEGDEREFGQGGFVWEYFRCELAARWSLALLRVEGKEHPLAQECEELKRVERLSYLEECLQWALEHHPDFLTRLQQLYRLHCQDPLELLRALSLWRLTYIEEMLQGELVSANRLLGSCAQLMICTEWQRMNRERGLSALEEMRKTDVFSVRQEDQQI